MTTSTTTASRGFPVLALLGAVLVVLKALGTITLGWIWVLAPFWAMPVLFLAVALLAGVGFLFTLLGIAGVEHLQRKRQKARRAGRR